MAQKRNGKTDVSLSLVELSMKIDEQIERLDELYRSYNETTDKAVQSNLKGAIFVAQKTIAKNKRLLRKLDGGY